MKNLTFFSGRKKICEEQQEKNVQSLMHVYACVWLFSRENNFVFYSSEIKRDKK